MRKEQPAVTSGASSHGDSARAAVLWNGGFNLFRDLLQFATMLLLVRLLRPESYGEFALVTSVIGFLSAFAFQNQVAYTLQVQSDADAQWQSQFTAGAVIQGALFLLTNIVALVLAWVPEYSAVAPYVHVMSLTFLLEWPSEIRLKMIERQFDWKRLRLLHAAGLILSAGTALTMAMLGAGTYALLVPGLLVAVPFIVDLFVVQGWRPTWEWQWEAYRPAWRFGVQRIASGLAGRGRRLLESATISAVVGFAAFGVLNRSLGLAQIFCTKLSSQLMYALYPILARMFGGAGHAFVVGGLVLRIVVWTVTPVAVVLSVLAAPVVRTLYGEAWEGVIALLPASMTWGALVAVAQACYFLVLARNRPTLCLWGDLWVLAGTLLALTILLPEGLRAYLIGSAGVQGALTVYLLIVLVRLQGVSVRGVSDAFVPALVAAIVALSAMWTLLRTIGGASDGGVVRALLAGGVFVSVYVLCLRMLFRRQLTDLVHRFPGQAVLCRLLRLPQRV